MAAVLVEVVNKALNLRGPQYPVGERLFLDPADPVQAAVLAHDVSTPTDLQWVRRVEAPVAVSSPTAAEALPAAPVSPTGGVTPVGGYAPPVDRMYRPEKAKRK